MISFGRGIRWYNGYQSEVEFSKKHGFDFIQIWFQNGIIPIESLPEPREEYIKKIGFPVIVHAVFKLENFEIYGNRLLEIVEYFEHNEVIVHPICRKSEIGKFSADTLAEQVFCFTKKV